MVALEKIREDLKAMLQSDQAIQFVEVKADTLEEALNDAAVQLDTRISNLEYEVLEKGFAGVVGMMRKPWSIRAYENEESLKNKRKKKHVSSGDSLFDDEFEDEEENIDRDGMFYVHYFGAQINLKVIPPIGNGHPVSLKEVMAKLQRSDTLLLEEDTVKKLVENGTGGVYEPVGQFDHVSAGDASFVVDVSNDEMKATITVSNPAIGGSEITPEQIERMLTTQGVVVGINKEKIDEFIDNPIYNTPYIVAEALAPVDGRDAYIAYNFETDRSKLRMKEAENGQVDFKELNLIQNVVEGQPLAQKMLPERGKAGKTVYGKYLEAKNGKDINLPLGKNVVVDSDGRTILAGTNGQVLLIGDKINVEPIMEVDNVSIKTGNITFLGTVIVKGNVDDGYNIKASGNIEVYGTVGNCNLDSDGDIVVNLGINGRDEGHIHAGKSLWAKFVQSVTVEVEEYVIVADGIINSDVTANKKILLQGKRAQIIGGHIFATEEISAKTIGSNNGGSETIVECGYDPKAKRRLDELNDSQGALVRELEEIDLNISTLENMKKIRRTLPPDKEENLSKFIERKKEITIQNTSMTEEIQTIQQHLRELKVIGKVSVSGTVYAGVKVYIRDVKDDVRADIKNVTFYYEGGFVRRGKYEAPDSNDLKRVPDGYSAN